MEARHTEGTAPIAWDGAGYYVMAPAYGISGVYVRIESLGIVTVEQMTELALAGRSIHFFTDSFLKPRCYSINTDWGRRDINPASDFVDAETLAVAEQEYYLDEFDGAEPEVDTFTAVMVEAQEVAEARYWETHTPRHLQHTPTPKVEQASDMPKHPGSYSTYEQRVAYSAAMEAAGYYESEGVWEKVDTEILSLEDCEAF